jgi:hypothetical protein
MTTQQSYHYNKDEQASEVSDRKLARHIVSLYWEEPEAQPSVMEIETLTSYISLCFCLFLFVCFIIYFCFFLFCLLLVFLISTTFHMPENMFTPLYPPKQQRI